MASQVSLCDFMSQLAICSEKAARIARHIRFMHHDFGSMIQEKELDENHQHLNADYKTLADVIIQEVIKRDLGKLYPTLEKYIFGEEDGSIQLHSSDQKVLVNVHGSHQDIINLLNSLFTSESTESIQTLANIISSSSNVTLPEQCKASFEQMPSDILIDLMNIGIWIDPVDGTQQYIKGTKSIVDSDTGIIMDGLSTALVLIGCFDRTDGHATLGVINRAFHEKNDEDGWNGFIYWGTALPNAKFNNLKNVRDHPINIDKKLLLHGSVDVDRFNYIPNNWRKLEVAACGNKLLSVALKQANIYLVTKPAAFNWDLCAAHAIIKSLDGQILDLKKIIDHFRDYKTIDNLDLSTFEIIYKYENSKSSKSECHACKPFITYYDKQDLMAILPTLDTNTIVN